jgi:hypothetical protein
VKSSFRKGVTVERIPEAISEGVSVSEAAKKGTRKMERLEILPLGKKCSEVVFL